MVNTKKGRGRGRETTLNRLDKEQETGENERGQHGNQSVNRDNENEQNTENRTTENAENSGDEGGERTKQYILSVPLLDTIGERFYCHLCRPIPRNFGRHNELSKHLRINHPQHVLAFRCNACGVVFPDLKKCKFHQNKTPACKNASVVREERPEVPTTAAPVQRIIAQPRQMRPASPRIEPSSQEFESSPRPRRKHVIIRPPSSSSTSIGEEIDTDSVELSVSSLSSPVSPVDLNQPGTSTALNQPKTSFKKRKNPLKNPPPNKTQDIPNQRFSPVIHRISTSDSDEIETPQPRIPSPRQHPPVQQEQPEIVLAKQEHQKTWTQHFSNVNSVEELETQLNELITCVREKAKIVVKETLQPRRRPNNPQNTHGRRRNAMNAAREPAFDAAAATRIQKMYRQCRPRAYREITEQTSPFCQIGGEELFEHFSQVFGHGRPIAPEIPDDIPDHEEPEENDPLAPLFTAKEVWERLKRCSNTAPGPDQIRYAVWKKFDPGAHILTSVFCAVQRLLHIPSDWTRSVTVLLHKKGDKQDVTNWRPIALSNTIGKLHSSVLDNRLAMWAIRNNRISLAQKGFMPVDGCAEHNFVLQSIIQDARRNRKRCAIAWLDLTNAFGSIPHQTIFTSLRWAGLSEPSIDTIRQLYASNSTSIRHTSGLTPRIPIQAGVKQGCPLSPIIFNLALEPILRAIDRLGMGYALQGRRISVLAYADDLVLVAESKEDLQRMLDTTSRIATWAGLTFNAKKCATLDIEGQKGAFSTKFTVQNANPPTLTFEQHYEHLGVPTGYTIAQSAQKVLEKMDNHVEKIDSSLLAPWQKFNAVSTFVLPCISFHLKNGVVKKQPLNKLDHKIRDFGKKWLNLPQRAGTEPLYLSNAMGGMGLIPLNILADVSQLVHAYRLIYSRDLSTFSMDLLKIVVKKRIRRDPRPKELAEYLNGSMKGDFRLESTDITSAWTRLRQATSRLNAKMDITWKWDADKSQLVLQLNRSPLNPKTAEYCLRSAIRNFFRLRLLSKPDQGKAHAVTSGMAASNHFMRGGDFTRFADWRFIHRARLDVVPLNATKRFGEGDKRCRRCHDGQLETLPHVLCHCWPHLGRGILKRHNAILYRLVKAFKPPQSTVVRVNQTVPGFADSVRPDITAIDEEHKQALIIDVSMPFENRYQGFDRCRQQKRQKYEALAEHFRQLGFEVFSDAFLVGPLGGWDPHNEYVLNRMKIGHRYRQLMRKLMVSDAIRWSRDIYVEHLTGIRQFTDDENGGAHGP